MGKEKEILKVVLPYPPTTGNHTTKMGAGKFYTVDKVKRYRAVIAMLLRENGLVLGLKGPLEVSWEVAPPNKRAVDHDNLCKIVQDALTKGGLWVDDSNKVIRKTVFEWQAPVECGFIVISVCKHVEKTLTS